MATGTAVGGGPGANKLLCSSALTISGSGGGILVGMSYDSSAGAAPTSVTDGTNAYAQLGTINDVATDGEMLFLYGAKNVAIGSYTPQANFTGTPGDGVIVAIPLTGRHTTAPFGTPVNAIGSPGTGANAVNTAAITAVAGDDVVLFCIDVGALRTGNFSAGTGFVERGEFGGGTTLDGQVCAADGVSAGSITPQATQANADRVARFAIAVAVGSGGGGRTFFVRSGLEGLGGSGPKQFNPSLS